MTFPPRLGQLLLSLTVLDWFRTALAADTAAWKGRSIYQTMTDRFARTDGSTTHACNTTEGLYCGGTWRGMINHLDYIQGMGFDAVMISPIIENIEGRVSYGEAYHGYWPLDLYSLNAHFGTHQDLLDLSNELHSRDMYLMMDTVINNMACITNGSDPADSVDYSVFTPFNSSKYFHDYCPIPNYNIYSVAQECWTGDDIVPLPDLKTDDPTVQDMLNTWIQDMISTYSIDGLRLDAAKHITPQYLPLFEKATGSFLTGEVLEQSDDIICNYQNNYISSVPNYPVYYAMMNAFTLGNTTDIADEIMDMKKKCPQVTALTSFSENHDLPRFASKTDDLALAKNVLTFTILFDGVPMIYQGQEQHLDGAGSPENREALWLSGYDTSAPLYKLITKLNKIRKHAYNLDNNYVNIESYPIYRGGSELAIRKGVDGRETIMVLSTQGTNSSEYTLTMPVSFLVGTVAMDVLNCKNYTVNERGELSIDMDKGEPRVLFSADKMEGSGLCGYEYLNVSYVTLETGRDGSSSTSGAWSVRGSFTSWSSLVVSVIAGVIVLVT